jgi:hypothetical protein
MKPCRHKVYAISVHDAPTLRGLIRCAQCNLYRRRPRLQIFDRKKSGRGK